MFQAIKLLSKLELREDVMRRHTYVGKYILLKAIPSALINTKKNGKCSFGSNKDL